MYKEISTEYIMKLYFMNVQKLFLYAIHVVKCSINADGVTCQQRSVYNNYDVTDMRAPRHKTMHILHTRIHMTLRILEFLMYDI